MKNFVFNNGRFFNVGDSITECHELGHRVFNGEGFELCDSDSVFSAADARFIEAAPELYEAAWKTDAVLTRLFETDEFAALLASGAAAALIACRDLLRAALSEAAGEEVVDAVRN